MTERLGLVTAADLEAALRDLGKAVAWPPTPDLGPSVTQRITDLAAVAPAAVTPAAVTPAAPTLDVRRAAPGRRRLGRSLPRSLLLAAAIALLLAAGALGVRFGLELLRIESGPLLSPTATAPAPGSPAADLGSAVDLGSALGLGIRTDLASVVAQAAFPVVVPADLGQPDAAFLGGTALRFQVAFVYAARDGLPASELLDGAGLLVTQARGRVDEGLVNKLVDSGFGSVRRVDVGGDEGYWFSGAPHFFWYLSSDGSMIEDSRRLVGDTLAWQHGDVLYRIEGDISFERALEIAASMR